jgi:hypothetical protein
MYVQTFTYCLYPQDQGYGEEEEEDEEEDDDKKEEDEEDKEEGEEGKDGDSVENIQGQVCCENHNENKDLSADGGSDGDSDDIEVKAEEGDKEEEVNLNIRVTCPLFKISPTTCPWSGTLGNLETHVRDSHKDMVTKGPNFVCKSVKDKVLLVLFNAEIFLYYKCFTENGMCYAAVQQVGTTNKKYKYTVKLLSVENTIGRIVIRFLMDSIGTKFKRVFEAGRCMAIEHSVLKPFIKNDQMSMIVTIEEVDLC